MEPTRFDRTCHFEQMEPRQLLAADVLFGAISFVPTDRAAESIQVVADGDTGGTISGRVFLVDSPANVNAADLPGLSGVTIRLLNETGDVVEQTRTDADGNYGFTDLLSGVYAVFQVQPATYDEGGATIGSGGGIAFENNLLGEIVVDAGYELTGYNFFEHSAGSVLETDADEQPIAAHSSNGPEDAQPIPAGTILQLPSSTSQAAKPDSRMPFASSDIPATTIVDTPVPPSVVEQEPIFGGSSSVILFAWHLSVLDSNDSFGFQASASRIQLASTRVDASTWQQMPSDQGPWRTASVDSQQVSAEHDAVFGHPDALAIAGDWDGDGRYELGVFLDGNWHLDRNGNGRWDEADLWAHLGTVGDIPVTGDWNGDGKTDIGVFGPTWSNGRLESDSSNRSQPSSDAETSQTKVKQILQRTARGQLRAETIDRVFHYGATGDYPITGDWNGNGVETIGVYRDGVWQLDVDGDGRFTDADITAHFGSFGDLPVVGDWDGSGKDQLGVFRAGTWILDRNGNGRLDPQDYARAFELGVAGDQPIVGDWDGNGTDDPGVFQPGNEQSRRASRPAS